MRLEAGGSLNKLLYPAEGVTIPFTTLDKLTILSKFILALAELHGCGCVHGDLVCQLIEYSNLYELKIIIDRFSI